MALSSATVRLVALPFILTPSIECYPVHRQLARVVLADVNINWIKAETKLFLRKQVVIVDICQVESYNHQKRGGSIRVIAQQLLSQVFLSSAQKKLFGDGVPILAYHSVGNPPPGVKNPYLYVTNAEFDTQLAQLRDAGFTSTSLDECNGFRGNPHSHVVISFDDGIRNVFDNALVVLARHQFRAIQFIISDLIGRRNEWMIAKGDIPEPLMDQHQIRDWLAAGHQIGAHSATHAQLVCLSPAQAREEIIGSKKRLDRKSVV